MRLVICGAGGLAREVYQMLGDEAHGVEGFLAPEAPLKALPAPYLGSEEEYVFSDDTQAILAIGDLSLRQKVHANLKARGVNFYTLIHPTACVAPSAKIGEGTIVGYHCVLYADTKVGVGNLLNGHNLIHHDTTIGDFNNLYSRVVLTGGVKLGDCNELGTAAVVLPGASLPSQSRLGAGSILHTVIKQNGHTLVGNPAGIVK